MFCQKHKNYGEQKLSSHISYLQQTRPKHNPKIMYKYEHEWWHEMCKKNSNGIVPILETWNIVIKIML
jgi:hypothetical protein